ncbi:hypothetical protein GNI_026530 [Gregarina niphandrodes]|uniref:Uncharacterized protein n=1 Tax=Gregarina niphandrodes TaxID=110365 RepID=A0A023BBK8_GRENI|nr:hypothetical protein GNI_026530 [Gregarina niphandrodes]EZG79402.1 hypothetical protein GNI_026530 [Gregarina niphandrodes]|eukprot:XP_011129049.1 hypothetical protein GNI_026530 [Gregarina niphandrodes]
MPVIKVTVEPPAKPYPQVSDLLRTLTDKRIKNEKNMMQDLEKSFNTHLENMKKTIEDELDKLLAIFDDKATLKKVVQASKATQTSYGFIEQRSDEIRPDAVTEVSAAAEAPSQARGSPFPDSGVHKEAAVDLSNKLSHELNHKGNLTGSYPDGIGMESNSDGPLSFVEKGIVDSLTERLSNIGSPSMVVQLMDVYVPDSSLEAKIKAIEDRRVTAEKNLFKVAGDMFDEVDTLTKNEIQINLQIQLDAFTADLDSIKSVLGGVSAFLEHHQEGHHQEGQHQEGHRQEGQHQTEQQLEEHCDDPEAKDGPVPRYETEDNQDAGPGRDDADPASRPTRGWSEDSTEWDLGLPRGGSQDTVGEADGLTFVETVDGPETADGAEAVDGPELVDGSAAVDVRPLGFISDSPGLTSMWESVAPGLSFLGIEAQQLNVAVGTPDTPYPTVADVVHEHLMAREASERLIRTKVLQMVQHLMTSHTQILKEGLRPRIAKAITTLSTVSSALHEL